MSPVSLSPDIPEAEPVEAVSTPPNGARPSPKQIACERCKRRKAKCDRHLPECHRCQEAGVQCEYSNRRRPGFPTGHRHVLEAKISKLEADLARLRNTTAGGTELPSATDEPPEDVVTCSAETTNDPTSEPAPSSKGSNQHQGPVEFVNIEPSLTGTSARTGKIKEQKPPADLVYSLSSLYFRHIHHWLPFLDARHVFADFATSDEPSLVSYALFGIALPYSHDTRLTRRNKDSYWKYSKRNILVEALEEPSFVSLEALAVLVLDLSGMTNGPQVWGVLAVAVKLALQLENITGRTLRASTSAQDQSVRPEQTAIRRLFWAIYALDCYISITTRHASELTDQHTQYLLSIRDFIWREEPATGSKVSAHSPSSQGSASPSLTPHLVFSYQLELLDISRRLHGLYLDYCTFSNEGITLPHRWLQSVMGCSSGLNAWYTDLPTALRIEPDGQSGENSPRSSPMVVMLNAYYHALTIYLHGLVDFSHQQGLEGQLSNYRQDSRASCIKSVEAIAYIGNSYLPTFGDKVGWPFAWASWIAARYCLVSKYYGRLLPPERFTALMSSLEVLSGHWQISGHYLRLLRMASDELEAAGTHSGHEVQQFLHAMVDWRVASCDLEDQARVDPLLPGSLVPPGNDGTSWYDLDMLMQDSGLDHLDGGGHRDMVPGQTPSSWFGMPTRQRGLYQEGSDQYMAPNQPMHSY